MKYKLFKNIKTFVSCAIALLVVVLGLGFVLSTQAVGTPTLTIGSQVASSGANITIPINASNFANSIAGMTFNVQYDSSLLTYTGYTQNAISGHGTLAVSDPAINPIAINWFDSVPLSVDNGAIITLNFTVISASVTTANLTFVGTKELSDSSDVVGSTFTNGAITLNPAKAITAFSFADPAATGSINEGAKTVAITVPYGTDVTTLVPTITVSSGASVSPLSSVSNDFTTPQTYTVTGADSLTQAYIVTVTVTAPSTIATVTSGAYTVNDGASTITGIPFGTTSSAFQNALTKGESHQTWNPAGLSSSVLTGDTFVVTAQSGATKTYTLTVSLNPAKNINSFSFTMGEGDITGTDIAVTVPYETVVTALVPTIVLSGGTVSPLSGVAQDFSNPVEYTVTAADGTSKVYTVTVTVALNAAANILSFDSTTPSAIGSISGTTITLTVPFGTSLTNLPIAITLSTGATVNPVAGNTTFVDGVPVTYTVTAQDGTTTKNYSVTATVAANTAKNITSFNFAGLTPSVTGVVDENTITLTVPYSTVISALVPTIGITGASVSPASGATQDFSSPVVYTVTAADSSSKVYTVTVTIAEPSDIATVTSSYTVSVGETGTETITNVPYATSKADFIAALTKGESHQGWNTDDILDPVVTGDTLVVTAQDGTTIVTYTITVNAPSDIATVTATGAYTISTEGTAAETITNIPYGTTKTAFLAGLNKGESHQGWDDVLLTNPVVSGNTLVVTAQDGTTIVTYTLTVKLNPAKSITGFTIPNQIGITTIDENAYTIQIIMPSGTVVAALVPTIIKTGASVSPDTGVAQDFSSTSTYIVTAADSSTQNYLVTVSVLEDTQTSPNESGNVNISSITPQVIIINPDQAVTVTLDDGVSNPSIDVSSLVTGGTGTLPAISITSDSVSGPTVEIPASTVVDGGITWNGVIAAPTVTTVTLPTTSGQTKTLSTAIELGFTGAKLSFDNAVKILLPGQAGKRAGYIRTGISFTEITTTCHENSQTWADNNLGEDEECKIDVGSDLVIWTKHFTSFATYTQTTNRSSSSGSSGHVISPIVPVVTTTTEGCVPGNLFSTTNGKTCAIVTIPTTNNITVFTNTIYNFGIKNLRLGSRGEAVKELQKFLNAKLNLGLIVDGALGPKTITVVKKWQKDNGLIADGIIGIKTKAKMNAVK